MKKLSRFEFEPNSSLRTIEKYTFTNTNIASILIPAHVTQISNGAFISGKIAGVAFEPNSELQIIEDSAFMCQNLTSIVIPANVTQIHEGAFRYCRKIQIIEFENPVDNSIGYKFSDCAIFMLPAKTIIKSKV